MVIYGLKNCDTCRKAAKALPQALLRDVRAEPLEAAELERFLQEFGEALINKKSATWRQMSDEDRTAAPLAMLAAHPALMKRPVIAHGDALFLGWGEETRKVLL